MFGHDDELPMMTLDQLIGHLQAIRREYGGDALVIMADGEPVTPPVLEMRESFLGNEPPEPFVILTDRCEVEETELW